MREKIVVKVEFRAGRLDAPGKIVHKSPKTYARNKQAGWQAYLEDVED